MKAKEIKGMSVNDIKDKLDELTATQDKMVLSHSVTKLENPLLIRSNRKDIARLKTELTSRAKKA